MSQATELLERPAPKLAPGRGGAGLPPQDDGDDGGGDGRSWEGGRRRLPRRAYFTGMIVGLAGITMLFAALASSYIVRQGLSQDWKTLALPGVLWLNTALLIGSSICLEMARRALKDAQTARFRALWKLATALGLAFVAGQAAAWWQLYGQGVYVHTNPSHSFFYVLTITHALHLLGGVAAMVWVMRQSAKLRVQAGGDVRVDLSALYWHFMDGIWIFLLALFLIGR